MILFTVSIIIASYILSLFCIEECEGVCTFGVLTSGAVLFFEVIDKII